MQTFNRDIDHLLHVEQGTQEVVELPTCSELFLINLPKDFIPCLIMDLELLNETLAKTAHSLHPHTSSANNLVGSPWAASSICCTSFTCFPFPLALAAGDVVACTIGYHHIFIVQHTYRACWRSGACCCCCCGCCCCCWFLLWYGVSKTVHPTMNVP